MRTSIRSPKAGRSCAVDPTVLSTFGAVIFTVLAQKLMLWQDDELTSEIICWLLLPFIILIVRRLRGPDAQLPRYELVGEDDVKEDDPATSPEPAGRLSLWVVALCLIVPPIFRAMVGRILLLPALIPLILAAGHLLRVDLTSPRLSGRSPSPPARGLFGRITNSIVGTVRGTILIAVPSAGALWNGNAVEFGVSAVPVVALVIALAALLPRPAGTLRFFPRIPNAGAAVGPLAWRLVALTTIALTGQVVLFEVPEQNFMWTVASGICKALSWFHIVKAARHASWLLTASIWTFSLLSTQDPFIQTLEVTAASHVGASMVSLSQLVYYLQGRLAGRWLLWLLALVSIGPYVANQMAIRHSINAWPHGFTAFTRRHPVEAVMADAKVNLQDMLDRQSKTFEDAVAEYKRRYAIEPPPGFKGWYDYAVEKKSVIIDDFDIIFDSVSPFFALSGSEVIDLMSQVRAMPDSDLFYCTLSAVLGTTTCSHPKNSFDRYSADLFNTLLKDVPQGTLPDINFLLNHIDEPRVLIPPRPAGARGPTPLNFTIASKQPTWDYLLRSCNGTSHRRVSGVTRPPTTHPTYGLPVTKAFPPTLDICTHPEYRTMHGFLTSPSTFLPISGLLPVLSTGAPTSMGDIIMPSPAYLEPRFDYDPTIDIDFSQKRHSLHWAGSTTGSFAHDHFTAQSNWPMSHRTRFVAFAQQLLRNTPTPYAYLRQDPSDTNGDAIVPHPSRFLNSRLYAVSFARIQQCTLRSCRLQRLLYSRTSTWGSRSEPLRHTLVFDADGNGISGRFRSLVASRSAPLKLASLFREWHDDRLVPWAHYAPVSLGMGELAETVHFLTSTAQGRGRAEDLARMGREWAGKALRREDMSVYVYRLVLELARLQDPMRVASDDG